MTRTLGRSHPPPDRRRFAEVDGVGAGSVALWVVIMVPVLLVFGGGLVLDGGRQLTMRADASAVAMAAARAGGQRSPQEIYTNTLNPALATTRANNELAAQQRTGTVTVVGGSITVTVITAVDYLLLPGGTNVTGTATVTPTGHLTGTSP